MERREATDQHYGAEVDPPYLYADYVGTRLRAPQEPLVVLPATPTELTAPVFGESDVRASDADLTRQHGGEPLGERGVGGGGAARRAGDRGRPRARLRRAAAAAPAGRDLAGERRRSLPARRRHARC